MSDIDNDKAFGKVVNSPMGRHLMTLAAMAFAVGVSWSTQKNHIDKVETALAVHITQNARDWSEYKTAELTFKTDMRERLRSIEQDNIRERERFFELQNKMTEVQADIRFIRQALERLTPPPARP
jgi:TolA-binding protein